MQKFNNEIKNTCAVFDIFNSHFETTKTWKEKII